MSVSVARKDEAVTWVDIVIIAKIIIFVIAIMIIIAIMICNIDIMIVRI